MSNPNMSDTLVACCGSLGYFLPYMRGEYAPHYPVPAIPLAVKYDYLGCVNIDDVTDPDDPIIVWMYDSWTGFNC